MPNKFGICVLCHQTIPYHVWDDGSSFPRGEWLAHNDWIVTGFDTEEEARAGLVEFAYLLDRYPPPGSKKERAK